MKFIATLLVIFLNSATAAGDEIPWQLFGVKLGAQDTSICKAKYDYLGSESYELKGDPYFSSYSVTCGKGNKIFKIEGRIHNSEETERSDEILRTMKKKYGKFSKEETLDKIFQENLHHTHHTWLDNGRQLRFTKTFHNENPDPVYTISMETSDYREPPKKIKDVSEGNKTKSLNNAFGD